MILQNQNNDSAESKWWFWRIKILILHNQNIDSRIIIKMSESKCQISESIPGISESIPGFDGLILEYWFWFCRIRIKMSESESKCQNQSAISQNQFRDLVRIKIMILGIKIMILILQKRIRINFCPPPDFALRPAARAPGRSPLRWETREIAGCRRASRPGGACIRGWAEIDSDSLL